MNLVRENSVDFDYARIPLIRTHGRQPYPVIILLNCFVGILMVFAWPILAWLGIGMARHMKPALPNGGWFLLHRVLVCTSLFFTCLSFGLIFIAFRNTEIRGLITLGSIVSILCYSDLFCLLHYLFVCCVILFVVCRTKSEQPILS